MIQTIGYVAAFLTTASFIPQVLKTLRSRDVSSISTLMYSMFTSGVFLWLVYGILRNDIVIIVANAITLLLAATVLIMKLKSKS